MNPFAEKYNPVKGTHCYYCEREFSTHSQIYVRCGAPLEKTREHIIPKVKTRRKIQRNYIAACRDCNCFKGGDDAREFAMRITNLLSKKESIEHRMYKLFPIMRNRAWKLYNKTSAAHIEYKKHTKSRKQHTNDNKTTP